MSVPGGVSFFWPSREKNHEVSLRREEDSYRNQRVGFTIALKKTAGPTEVGKFCGLADY
jgi:hypothetical protein